MIDRLRGRLARFRSLHRIRDRLGPLTWRLDRAIDRRTLDEGAFREALGMLGVRPGATVMVHCSMDHVARRVPAMNAMALVRTLQELLTPDGTLLMPTSPFNGSQLAFVRSEPVFDVRRSPSRLGLATELFRRLPDVERSRHPTHSVAAWGRHAKSLTASHHLGSTFGEASPFCALREHGGIVVGVGVGMRQAFTIQHVVEYLHPRSRAALFSAEQYVVPVVDGDSEFGCTVFPLAGGIHRNVVGLEDVLRADGTLTSISRRGLRLASVEADAFIERGLAFIESGRYLGSA